MDECFLRCGLLAFAFSSLPATSKPSSPGVKIRARSQHGQRIRNGNEAEGNLQHYDKPGRIIDWGYIAIPDRHKRRHAEIQKGNELAQQILADILAFEGSASEQLIDRHIHHRENKMHIPAAMLIRTKVVFISTC